MFDALLNSINLIPHVVRPCLSRPVGNASNTLAFQRDAIVIAGNCAEGGVSFAALGALESGYQPYVVVDAIGARRLGGRIWPLCGAAYSLAFYVSYPSQSSG